MTEGDHIDEAEFALHKPMLAVLTHFIFFHALRNGYHKDLHQMSQGLRQATGL